MAAARAFRRRQTARERGAESERGAPLARVGVRMRRQPEAQRWKSWPEGLSRSFMAWVPSRMKRSPDSSASARMSLSRRNKWGNKNTAVSSGVNPFPAVALALFLTVGAVYCYGFHKGILQQLQVAVSLKGYSFVAAVRPRRQAQSEFLPVCEESGVSFAHSKSVRVMLYVFENGVKVSAGPQNLVVEAFCENGNESGCGCGLRCKQGVPVLQPLTGKGFQACYICA